MSHRPIHALARRYESRFADTFLRSVKHLRLQITDDLVEQVMQGGLVDEPVALYELVDQMELAKIDPRAKNEAVRLVLATIIADAAEISVRLAGHEEMVDALRVDSPYVLNAARKLTADLVTNVARETKRAIRRIIFESVRDGVPPAESARVIREIVGLTRGHALAVKRFAETHTERGTARYARKLLNWRARAIARTETLRAANAGQVASWRQMADRGMLDVTRFREQWSVTPDERLCERCAPMEGKQVSLDGTFQETERGILPSERVPVVGETVEYPPLHVMCRCTLIEVYE